MVIGGYKSGSDIDARVYFGRASFTDTGERLPGGGEYPHSDRTVHAILKEMPASSGIQRIGAFYCQAEKDGEIERINTIIMAADSKMQFDMQILFTYFQITYEKSELP